MIHQLGVSKTRGGPPKSSILIGFSLIFTIHFGVPLFVETSNSFVWWWGHGGGHGHQWMVESLQEKSLKLGKEGNDGQSLVIFSTYINIYFIYIYTMYVMYFYCVYIYINWLTGFCQSTVPSGNKHFIFQS